MHTNQHKTEILNTRMEPTLKGNAERILKKLGLSNAQAIRLFYVQICLNKGLPFDVKIPNKSTMTSMDELNAGKSKKFNSVKALLEDLND